MAGTTTARPMVAIVGRPNVGKSTLFNRLARQKLAIVEDVEGVTRDRHYADAFVLGREYVLIDTGGFDPDSDDPMKEGIAGHVELALEECDIVICAFDGSVDPTSADLEAVKLLRGTDKPVLYVANKADSEKQALGTVSYYELGLEKVFPVSALHGRGLGDLEEALAKLLPEPAPEGVTLEDPLEGVPRVALVGRPNAGKSSLVNRLTGEDRQLVDDRPGTTVDTVDTLLERDGHRLVLIDTAGMRRKRKVRKQGVEALSVYQAIRAMERSDLVVLMIDAHEGVGEQDAKIAGLAVDRGCALVIGLNKGDLMSRDEIAAARQRTREVLSFAPWAPMVTLSAKTGRGVKRLLKEVDRAVTAHQKRVKTAALNRFFEEVLERHPPPTQKNRAIRLYYVTQAASAPPTFVVVTNYPKLVHFSYQRYVENQLRERFGFEGTPLKIRYKAKRKVQLR
ncbi:MAG TPA: ribosome biogenesis GTPase Der [Polyangiaceae bacterium LLY-WYZ-15_(1-7)]|nr:ribosome biogenesis GTPase Der [Polyangiaceae bacterium LLY-WYZ-15_(1-7)]HJL45628.1 ribosome biogenesis GTPase Der [Polyangiaceae bacterium LLY-WYZ-15_(1-7)]